VAILALAAFSLPVLPLPARAQGQPAAGDGSSELWFEPTQLPSFTGAVERYLVSPRGEVDASLSREGPQVSFPPEVADGLRHAVATGRPLTIWVIRARSAPVLTMLAFAPNAETTPMVLDRFYLRASTRGQADRGVQFSVSGAVRSPYYAPQGEVVGAVLEDGPVVLLPRTAAATEGFRALLRPDARISADGIGYQGEDGRAVLADQFGNPGAPRPMPRNDTGPRPGAAAPARSR
jgi:hypothetical protein